MHSDLFSLGPITIHSYGLCMAIAFLTTYALGCYLYRREKRDTEILNKLLFMMMFGGVIGARLLYVIQNWSTQFANDPLNIFKLWQGGLVFYGGFFGAVLMLIIYAKWFERVAIRDVSDFVVTLLPIGHAIGRIGCFFHGCCFGGQCQSPIGVSFPHGSPAWIQQVNQGLLHPQASQALPVYPTQLIESVGNAVIFLILISLFRKTRPYLGLQTGLYAILYSILRFSGEMFRDDPRGDTILGLSFSQATSCGLIIVGIIFVLSALISGQSAKPVAADHSL